MYNDFSRGKAILDETLLNVAEKLSISAQNELGEFYDDYVSMVSR